MAANIIGLIGDKQGADILLAQLDRDNEPNLRFAIYEALGRINSMRSVIGLSDGLAEEDEMVLMAVITGMNNLTNPGIVKVINERLDKADEQSERIKSAIVTGRAAGLFAEVYKAPQHAEALVDALLKRADSELFDVFRPVLEKIGTEKALADAKRLQVGEASTAEKRILAADDSKAMLFFYKGAVKELDMEIVTVEDGKKAFDLLQLDSSFDLLISDMNMPNMDGIELTRELRKQDTFKDLPILMATTESEQSQSALAREAGVTDFINKPFTKEELKNKLAQLI